MTRRTWPALALALALAGCGGPEPNPAETPPPHGETRAPGYGPARGPRLPAAVRGAEAASEPRE